MGMFGRETARRSGGYWSQPHGTPRDRDWWRFNWTAFMGLVLFLERKYPDGLYTATLSGNGIDSWLIRKKKDDVIAVEFGGGSDTAQDWHRLFDRRLAPPVFSAGEEEICRHEVWWVVNGRFVRRHGVSEGFMAALEVGAPQPRYLRRFPLTRCKHGHDLTDPANVYTLRRRCGGAEHVERRCRSCNRSRVARFRSRLGAA